MYIRERAEINVTQPLTSDDITRVMRIAQAKALSIWKENMKMSKLQCYLASKDIIHRDLATRNVLLSKDKTAKVDYSNLFLKMQNKF